MPSPVHAIAIAARIMSSDLFRLNASAQNLANANTTGYKKDVVAARPFVDYLDAGRGLDGPPRAIPVAMSTLARVTDFAQGPLSVTGNPLDVAIEGDGFFEVAGADGPLYTRQGAFRLDERGRLVTPGGLPVAGLGGELALGTATPVIDRLGRVFVDGRQLGQLKLVRFADPSRLVAQGGGLYRAHGPAEPVADALQVRQGFLESSNVAALPEMTRMIELTRRFESAQRVVQGYDGMLGTAIRTFGEL